MKRIKVDLSAPSAPADKARLQEMFASQQAPGARYTDRAFLQDRQNGKQFEDNPWAGDFYKKKAKAAGVSTVGKVYMGGLAKYAGDPRAWVDSTSDVIKVAKERNLTVSGAVECQGEEMPPPPSVELAPDIVNRIVRNKVQEDPGLLQRTSLREVREAVVDKHSMKRKETQKG